MRHVPHNLPFLRLHHPNYCVVAAGDGAAAADIVVFRWRNCPMSARVVDTISTMEHSSLSQEESGRCEILEWYRE
jgi:hypothetical protein